LDFLMNTVDALTQARVLIETGWCQGSAAKTGDGRECFAHSEHACQFCPTGAVTRVTWPWEPDDDPELWEANNLAWEALAKAIRNEYGWDMSEHLPWSVIQDWNDEPGRTKEEVLEMFDRAIELVEEE
jgi:hypothetical protein